MPPNREPLGIFPLPHVVLFPNAQLPLHVFEPRYRELVAAALDTSRRFVMAVLKPGYEDDYHGSPAVHPWACTGKIVEHQRLADGRFDLILEGEQPVEIKAFEQEEPFRIARVRHLPTDRDFAEGSGAKQRIAELSDLLEAACPGCVEALARQMPNPSEGERGLQLLHTIAMHFPVDVNRKLEWLRCPGTLARWQAMRDTLKEVAADRNRRTHAIARYADLAGGNPSQN